MMSALWMFFSPALPEIILAIGACVLLLLGAIHKRQDGMIDYLARSLIFGVLLFVLLQRSNRILGFNDLVISDNFTLFLKVMILSFGAAVLIISRKTVELEDIQSYEYPILILFSILGMMIMVSSHDLMTLFLGLELQSLSLYILTTIRRDDSSASEAGLKYFILGSVSTGLLLFGISLIYGFAGTTDYAELGKFLSSSSVDKALWFGLVFVMAGLAFKVSAVPFHMWTPDVYEGTPTSVTTFLAVVPKLAAFGLMIRLLVEPLQTLSAYWTPLVIILSAGSMVIGAFAALGQQNFKRLLAYSAISNMGYALMGLVGGSQEGVRATLIYLFLYALMSLGIFGCLLNLVRRGKNIQTIQEMRGMSQTYPGTAFVLAFVLFSMAGIPPLAGFLGKLYVFQAVVAQGYYSLAIVGVLTSVVGAAYYLYVIKVLVMDAPKGRQAVLLPLRRDPAMSLILGGVVLFLTWFFINPTPMMDWASLATKALWQVK